MRIVEASEEVAKTAMTAVQGNMVRRRCKTRDVSGKHVCVVCVNQTYFRE